MAKHKDYSWLLTIAIIGLAVWGYNNGFFTMPAPESDGDTDNDNTWDSPFQSSPSSEAPVDTCTNHAVPPGLWSTAHDAHVYCNQFYCPTCYYNNGTIWPKGCMAYPDKGFDSNGNPVIDSQWKTCYCESLV